MLQRIQTLYLLLVALVSGIAPWVVPAQIAHANVMETPVVILIFLAVSALALISIFMFRKRQHQFVLNRLNLIVNLFLLGFFVYRSLSLPGETSVSEKGIGMLIPVFSIVFLVLANRAIKKDEDLVKSVDRLR